MTDTFNIRSATRADGGAVRALVGDVLREFGFELESHTTDADLADLEASYIDPGGMFDVVEDAGGTIVGCVGLHVAAGAPDGRRTGELRKMYLRPAMRGHGLGGRLLARVIDFARANGFGVVVLETASNLTVAIAMYQRHGFVESPCAADCASRCDKTFRLKLS